MPKAKLSTLERSEDQNIFNLSIYICLLTINDFKTKQTTKKMSYRPYLENGAQSYSGLTAKPLSATPQHQATKQTSVQPSQPNTPIADQKENPAQVWSTTHIHLFTFQKW